MAPFTSSFFLKKKYPIWKSYCANFEFQRFNFEKPF
jgi:hypothetical protein